MIKTASGTVTSGGEEISGRARVDDSCGGVLAGTFAFRK
jgi:hypothetical protein